MKKIELSFILFLFALGTYLPSSQAAHVFGTDLSYKCLGNGQYEVTLSMYRDCGGTAPPAFATISINSYSCHQTLADVDLFLDSAVSNKMVTPLCASFAGSSSCNGGALPGEDLSIYRGIINLPAECPDWVVSLSWSFRSASYTNIATSGSDNIYIEALIDNSFGACHHSPVFRHHPMLYACAGYSFVYDMGAIDFAGDSLVYTLIPPKTSATQDASFNTGFSLSLPLSLQTGIFDFNTRTGRIAFTPQGGLNQFACLSIRVDKWHHGKIVASTMAEMDIGVNASCQNASLELSDVTPLSSGWSYNDTMQAFIACSGSTTPFEFAATVHDINGNSIVLDTTYASKLNTLFGAGSSSITLDANAPLAPDSAHVVTQITPSSLSLPFPKDSCLSLDIAVHDNACPYRSILPLKFGVFEAFLKASTSHPLICEGSTPTVQLGVSGTNIPSNIQWTQVSNGAPTVAINNPNSLTPSLTIPTLTGGTVLQYEVSAMLASCLATDTINIYIVDTPTISFQVTHASTMSANDGSVIVTVDAGNLAQFEYQWQNNSTATTIQNLAVGDYQVTISDYYGCQSVDTATVNFNTSVNNIAFKTVPFKVAPNPTQNKSIQIQVNALNLEAVDLMIFNSLGQVILTKPNLTISRQQPCRLNLKDQPSGMYWLQIQMNSQSYVQKIVLD